MKDIPTRDIIGRVALFAGLTLAMYYIHLLSWRHEQKQGWVDKW